MTGKEAAKLLSLIKLAYPSAYKALEENTAEAKALREATVRMWLTSFRDTPYALVEQAFSQHRMVSRFPPTVVEIVDELARLYGKAANMEAIGLAMGDTEKVRICRQVMTYTEKFTNRCDLSGLNFESMKFMLIENADKNLRLE